MTAMAALELTRVLQVSSVQHVKAWAVRMLLLLR